MSNSKDIRKSVEAELTFDPLIDPTNIIVKNIDGDIALNGTVASYPQYLEAAAATRRVFGVTKVHNHLEVLLPPSSYRDDTALTTAANNALVLDVTVPLGVQASVKNGNVTLTGTVSHGSQRTAAAATVAGLSGVRNVDNEIEILSDAAPVDVVLRVQDALDRYALLVDDSDVLVDTDENTVTLVGHVRTWAEHDAVIDAVWRADGVYYVRDDLLITG
jgi:osmotically-inducible protein OsmY